MTRKERAQAFFDILKALYPKAPCTLDYTTPCELLIATQLAAQCTDKRVNIVTKELFKKYPDLQSFANASLKELEEDIRPTGFYHNKAKNIIGCAKKLIDEFDGVVPDNMEDLLSLPGVGRKTANLVLGDIFNKGGMVIDTHAKRLLFRVGLTRETDPYKIEMDVEKLISRENHSEFCHRLVEHGRRVCTARNPKCKECKASPICKKLTKKIG